MKEYEEYCRVRDYINSLDQAELFRIVQEYDMLSTEELREIILDHWYFVLDEITG